MHVSQDARITNFRQNHPALSRIDGRGSGPCALQPQRTTSQQSSASLKAVAAINIHSSAKLAGPHQEDLSALEQRIALAENNLKGVSSALKGQQNDAFSVASLQARAQQVQKQLEEARECRTAFQERARLLGERLKQEREEREAWVDAFSTSLQKTLKDLNDSVKHSLSDSNKQMMGRLDVADITMKKLVQQLNEDLSQEKTQSQGQVSVNASTAASSSDSASRTPSTLNESRAVDESNSAARLAQSMSQLLEENKLLQQRQQALINQRRRKSQSPLSRPSGGACVSNGLLVGSSSRSSCSTPVPSNHLAVQGAWQLPTVHERTA